MAKNNSGLVLGLGMLGVAGVGVWFYLKDKGVNVFGVPDMNFASRSSSPAISGISEASAEITAEDVNNSLVQDMRSQGEAYLDSHPNAFSGMSSGPSGGSYSLGQSISSGGKSTPTISLSASNSPSQNISIGASLPTYTSPSGTKEGGYMSITAPKSSSGSSIVSSVKDKASSAVNSAKNFLSGFF